ncbi:MAG TPA: hydroxyphenylacetyl-CoA thioesterase PaaI [Steroidobacteraceae bacterium]|nr:hydroxyphenylacetyl-CoA thioesterase PaaI [Steroidobacteraceae bacterium]
MKRDEPADPRALAQRSATALYAADLASQSLGMRLAAIAPRECTVTMTVRGDMINGLGTCHGGIIFALADSAFAFACNSDGAATVAASSTVEFLAAARVGDELTATARAVWQGRRAGLYDVQVVDQQGTLIALFRGRSQRLSGRDPRAVELK